MEKGYMLVRTDNVPTDMSGEFKGVEGPKEVLERMAVLMNEYNHEHFYFIEEVENELHDPHIEIYGEECIADSKTRFSQRKVETLIEEHIIKHMINDYELAMIGEMQNKSN